MEKEVREAVKFHTHEYIDCKLLPQNWFVFNNRFFLK